MLQKGRWPEACRAVAGLSFDSSLTQDEQQHLALKEEPIFVDSIEKLANLERKIFSGTPDHPMVVAFDFEFHTGGNKAATLQIAFRTQDNQDRDVIMTYVIDLVETSTESQYHQECVDFVQKLFCQERNRQVLVLGFSVTGDIQAIDNALGTNASQSLKDDRILDLQKATKQSLAKLTRSLCPQGVTLSKTKHKKAPGSWSERPLHALRLEYAALDAAVLLVNLAERVSHVVQ